LHHAPIAALAFPQFRYGSLEAAQALEQLVGTVTGKWHRLSADRVSLDHELPAILDKLLGIFIFLPRPDISTFRS
jgi:hypothetical protein